jgi:serine/threonine protein kinase/Flp pilus assembly protein TadD
MTPERWQKVEQVYHAALERAENQRAAYLREACAGDDALWHEVESLLAQQTAAGSFLEAPAIEVAAEALAEDRNQSSLVGKQLGSYKIVSLLGAGGMGEVYKAHDTKLGREVAIKILPAAFVHDPERLSRFQREARMLASLNHPNIATIHGLEQADAVHYLVMELVPGQTLAERVSGGALKIEEVLKVAAQIAEALEAAHERGVIHRDLKPANVKVTPEGRVKVLDFGLAKTQRDEKLTADRAIMGTPAYMAPEQVRGEELDARTDLFSFGAVLYEMATGRLAFAGNTAGAIHDAVLNRTPTPAGRVNPDLPSQLGQVVSKALEKDRQLRYQSAADIRIDLARLKRDTDSGRAAPVGADLRSQQVRKTIDSLAVLPFVNLSGDAEMDYLSDGITDTLINSLSQLRKLRVVPRSLTFRYKGREVDPQHVGSELNARAVLTGRVMQRGDTLLIGTELIDVARLSQLWGAQYNRKMADILALQDEIAREISEKLRLQLTGEEKKRLTKRATGNKEAYQDYLKGRYWSTKKTHEGTNKGIAYFRQAIAKDPNYALAYAGLAVCYIQPGIFGFVPPTEAFPKAKEAALKALELDESLAEAHTSLAYIKALYDWDWSGAERESQRAIALNPSSAGAHVGHGAGLVMMGRSEEAVAELKRAVEFDPVSLPINWLLGVAFYCARQYDQAIEQELKTLELDPTFILGYFHLGQAYVQKSMYKEAVAEFEKALAISPGNTLAVAGLGYGYGVTGRRVEAEKVLDQLNEISKRKYVPTMQMVLIYTGLGEKDKAFEWLERAYEARSMGNIKSPTLDPLRSDPRFADLLRRMNLQQ